MSDTIKSAEFNEDIFDSMLNGTFEEEVLENDGVDDDAEDAELDDENDNDDYEDTDQDAESEDDEELDEAGDGELDEDSEDEDVDEEENAPVEDDSSDDEDGDAEGEDEDSDDEDEDGADEDTDEESEDDTDTEEDSDGDDSKNTDEVDYKAFYEAVVNTEFVINGKKTKGFADPAKIIQSQQMAGGFSEKMAGFKQYRPYMAPLKERGMLEDQAKFDLAMNLIDGDKEAIKKHLASLEIDPLDLDMEKIAYSGKPTVASKESLIIEDVMERAKATGIEDRVRQVVGSDWDSESFNEFIGNDAVRNDLLNHIETGAYDVVQDKMAEMSRLDYNGSYGSMNSISKYRAAVKALQSEQPAAPKVEAPASKAPTKVVKKASSVKSEKAKIEQARKEEEYALKAAERNAKVSQQRKRAASMSKKKPKAKPKAKWDPAKAEGAEFDELFDFLVSGGR